MVSFDSPPPMQTVAERFAFHVRREWRKVSPVGPRTVEVQVVAGDTSASLFSILQAAANVLRVNPSFDGNGWPSDRQFKVGDYLTVTLEARP